jgi:HAD superfamily phosphatase (TIGR01668 family)
MSCFLELFRPNECVDSLTEINLEALRLAGYDTILLDLDNTILPWKDGTVPEKSEEWIKSAKVAGFKLCIVSNTHNPVRLVRIANALEVKYVFRALKPRRYGFRKAAELTDSTFPTCVVVGDQLLTDVAGGNMAGMRTVLVKPMHHREFFGTKLSRLVERVIFARLASGGRGDKR